MAGPKEGIALVFGAPKKAPTPAGPDMDDEPSEDYAEMIRAAFPGTEVDVEAFKEAVMACMGK